MNTSKSHFVHLGFDFWAYKVEMLMWQDLNKLLFSPYIFKKQIILSILFEK
jgi:hypothetical protein